MANVPLPSGRFPWTLLIISIYFCALREIFRETLHKFLLHSSLVVSLQCQPQNGARCACLSDCNRSQTCGHKKFNTNFMILALLTSTIVFARSGYFAFLRRENSSRSPALLLLNILVFSLSFPIDLFWCLPACRFIALLFCIPPQLLLRVAIFNCNVDSYFGVWWSECENLIADPVVETFT